MYKTQLQKYWLLSKQTKEFICTFKNNDLDHTQITKGYSVKPRTKTVKRK